MDFSEFIQLPDLEKVFLIESRLAKEVQDLSWTATGSGSYYCTVTWGESVSVKQLLISSGVTTTYTEVGSVANCDATASSFYVDFINSRLYVHTSGNDSPDTSGKYCILAYFYIGFTNSQFVDDPITYAREEEALLDGDFEQWYSATDLVQWTESISGTSTINRESSSAHVLKGEHCLRIDYDASDSDAYVWKNVILKPNGKAKIQVWYKMSTIGKTGGLLFRDPGGNVYLKSDGTWQVGYSLITLPNSTSWTLFELEFIAHQDYETYRLYLGRSSMASASIYFDDAHIKVIREPMYYLPIFDASTIPNLVQAVGDYHIGSLKTQFGSLAFLNDGWWYTALENFHWHNKEIDIKCGKKNSKYDQFGDIFAGKIRDPDVGDTRCVLGVKDRRVGNLRQLPKDKYWKTTGGGAMDDLEDGAQGRVIGIPFGELTNITPVFIKTDGSTYWRYKFSKYEVESIDNVYKNGEVLTSGTDYTKDAANGQFDLLDDPGYDHITCDVKGIKCDLNDGTYSERVADILHFILTQENDLTWANLDKVAFDDLKTNRSQALAWYFDASLSTWNFIRFLQATGVFQFVPLSDGRYAPIHYQSGTDENTPRLYNEDYDNLRKIEETDATYKRVVIKYGRNPTTGIWLTAEKSEDKVSHRYDEEETLRIETALRTQAAAESLASFYLQLVRQPLTKLDGVISSLALGFKPSDKIIVSKQIIDGEGKTVQVFGESPDYEEIYRILELKKSLKTAKVGIYALLDEQSLGEHANVPHTNSHSDSHSNVPHSDNHDNAAHSNSYDDVPHENSYIDVPHVDEHEDHNDAIPP